MSSIAFFPAKFFFLYFGMAISPHYKHCSVVHYKHYTYSFSYTPKNSRQEPGNLHYPLHPANTNFSDVAAHRPRVRHLETLFEQSGQNRCHCGIHCWKSLSDCPEGCWTIFIGFHLRACVRACVLCICKMVQCVSLEIIKCCVIYK